jgi:transposase InsO family protein
MRNTERLADVGIEPSVGSHGDSYDNALAESIIGLFNTEVIRRKGRGGISRRWNSRASTGSTGSNIAGYLGQSATCRRRSMRQAIMSRLQQPDSQNLPSDDPGTIQSPQLRLEILTKLQDADRPCGTLLHGVPPSPLLTANVWVQQGLRHFLFSTRLGTHPLRQRLSRTK